VSFGSAS